MDNAALSFYGDSICEWADKLDSFERNIHYGGGFNFAITELSFNPTIVKKLRCLSVAGFEIAERPNATFKEEVIMGCLNSTDKVKYRRCHLERFIEFLKREWAISDLEAECAEFGLISVKWLMSKQTNQHLNWRLHQAFDYVEMFHDIYTLDGPEDLIRQNQPVSRHFVGLFERCSKESNAWLRFAKGYVLIDLLSSGTAIIDHSQKREVDMLRRDYSELLERWTSPTGIPAHGAG